MVYTFSAVNFFILSCSWLKSCIFKCLRIFTRWHINFLKWTQRKFKVLLQIYVNPIQQTKLDRLSYFFCHNITKSYGKIWYIWSNNSPYVEAWTKWGLKRWCLVWCVIKKERKLWSEEKMGCWKRSSHGINSITWSTNIRLIICVYWDCKDFTLEITTEWRHQVTQLCTKTFTEWCEQMQAVGVRMLFCGQRWCIWCYVQLRTYWWKVVLHSSSSKKVLPTQKKKTITIQNKSYLFVKLTQEYLNLKNKLSLFYFLIYYCFLTILK